MGKASMDRRVKYTRNALKDSLVQLMQDRPVSRITIKEICEHADVNRGTFYAHYKDQFDLLRQTELALIDDINAYLDSCPVLDNQPLEQQMLTDIVAYIGANASLCKLLLGETGDMDFIREIKTVIEQRLTATLPVSSSVQGPAREAIYAFMITGSLGVIQRWLDSGQPLPAEEVARLVLHLSNRGLSVFTD
jgi:AcrR family transcriptional regulator